MMLSDYFEKAKRERDHCNGRFKRESGNGSLCPASFYKRENGGFYHGRSPDA